METSGGLWAAFPLSGETLAEAPDTTGNTRIPGLTGGRAALMTSGPYRVPHHTILDAGLIGGHLVKNVTWLSQQQACSLVPVYGQAGDIFYKQKRGPAPMPGEVSRAPHGMLFLNEWLEFRAHRLGVLCQTIEERVLYRPSRGHR